MPNSPLLPLRLEHPITFNADWGSGGGAARRGRRHGGTERGLPTALRGAARDVPSSRVTRCCTLRKPRLVRNLTRNSKDMRAVYTTLAANYWSLFLMNAKFDSGLLFQLLWINR